MQLGLIFGIAFAIVAVLFALQNNIPVTVTLAVWHLEGSLALILLVALGLGALIAGLVSSPAMIRRQWMAVRLGHQVRDLEKKLADEQRRSAALAAELDKLSPPLAAAEKPYVGLKTLLAGKADDTPPT